MLFARLLVLFTDPCPGFHHRPLEQSLSSVHIHLAFTHPIGHHSGCILCLLPMGVVTIQGLSYSAPKEKSKTFEITQILQ